MSMQRIECYCGRDEYYDRCCAPYIIGDKNAPNPEALMRSRYTAFCTQNADYLLETLYKNAREKESRRALVASFADTQWCSLKVIRSHYRNGQKHAEVEFAAFYLANNTVGQLHERSRFVFEDEKWFYTDGDILPPISLPRNEQCWCGSGRKLKKCHPD
ncbi:Uncharacterised protein [Zhongshania aliphaticivorans]|uniref:YchJ-like middle NTF2-like domain-containing protein n=1 Tax=Zhongshania aliphaticivorans TaxID=1470434 RepID=A0A5S9NJY0_9GAMM|nr:YchJ family metal-binding protein [Zhongshania aliphaticivorans]CAA0089215.1 Uncharacterised protein [Zhongshania aliphaticivorans]CAA0095901.1 Uncharacterised protein [Zhongshania aliphaticivorans]